MMRAGVFMSSTAARVLVILGVLAPAGARGTEQDVQALLSKVDVSDPGHGTRTYGEPKIDVFKGDDGTVLLIYQALFGGDGDHTENRVKVFRFTRGEPKKVLDQNLDSVSFVEADGVLTKIRGNVVELLCDVCDGPDAAAPQDIFLIPVTVDLRALKVVPSLDGAAREALLARVRERAKANVAELSACCSRPGYSSFAATVVKRVEALLSRR